MEGTRLPRDKGEVWLVTALRVFSERRGKLTIDLDGRGVYELRIGMFATDLYISTTVVSSESFV